MALLDLSKVTSTLMKLLELNIERLSGIDVLVTPQPPHKVGAVTNQLKYIGETANHLAQIFARASRMNGVLLFDEADALFAKRTEVKDSHDRYANADTSYFLQLFEEYRGIVILATNKKQNIDPVFIRRVRYVFEFPRPDASERGRIWRQGIGELSGDETLKQLETSIEVLAANVELSGAQIKTRSWPRSSSPAAAATRWQWRICCEG